MVWLQVPHFIHLVLILMGASSEALWNFSPEESQKELQQGYTVGFMRRAFAQLIHINEHLIYARHSIRFLGDTAVNKTGKNPYSCGVDVCFYVLSLHFMVCVDHIVYCTPAGILKAFHNNVFLLFGVEG